MSPFRSVAAGIGLLACVSTAQAAEEPGEAERIARLERQVAEQREQIARLERLLAEQSAFLAGLAPPARSQAIAGQAAPDKADLGAPPPSAMAAMQPPRGGQATTSLDVSGDLRLREEFNFSAGNARDRARTVLRARLRAAYAVNDWLTVGGQLATGDPDDPNSTDVTLFNFDDDLQVSLDQAYIRLAPGNFRVYLGKMPQPFVRTELVWDGDVSPEGISASYLLPLGGAKIRANALYFIVDEAAAGPDSRMVGGQIAVETASAPVQAELAVGYYDYSLRSLAGATEGDFRSNLFANGRYLSDFNLLDVIGAVTWNGLGQRWPVRLVGDYVHNFGAATEADTGFGIDLLVGRSSQPGDWRFAYGYAEAGTDAVLAAFSHDNTNLATNYLQHTLAVDYIPRPNLTLNTTYYRYRQKDTTLGIGPIGWQNRLRLNFMVGF